MTWSGFSVLRTVGGTLAAGVVVASCSTDVTSSTVDPPVTAATSTDAVDSAPTTEVQTEPDIDGTIETSPSTSTMTVPAATTSTSTTTTTTSTTTVAPASTLAPLPDDVFDADCVVRSPAAGSLELFAATQSAVTASDDTVRDLWIENGFVDTLDENALVDICLGNGVHDIDGTPVPGPDDPTVIAALTDNVVRQQEHLNTLFAPFASEDLGVDGVSGPRTGQRLCGARLSLGIEASMGDMTPGSQEQSLLFATEALTAPASDAVQSEQWVLIDRACQLMFTGTGPDLVHVFVTSTGSEGFETRLQDRAEAFRFNPAVENGGWHDSSEFPVGVDNPLNGNMYKPLYFDLGQAIHGANSVPPAPDSKGCARLRVGDQNTLVGWLGLDDAEEETWRKSEMNVTVSVQGEFVGR